MPRWGLEQHLLAQVVADLRLMPVVEGAVGAQAHFAKTGIDGRLATGPGDAGYRIDDGLPSLGNQTGLLQRFEGAQRSSRVATWHSNQLGGGNGIAVPFRQTVGGLLQQLLVLVGEAVEGGVELLVLDPEGAGEIQHRQPLGQESGASSALTSWAVASNTRSAWVRIRVMPSSSSGSSG